MALHWSKDMTHIYEYKHYGIINPVEASNAHVETSDKYRFQSTKELLTRLEGHNFEVTGTSFGKPRKQENLGFQKHIVVLERPDFNIDGDNKFQLLLTNDHSGKSSLKLDMGIYRAVCANGLVVGDNLFHAAIPHKGKDFGYNLDAAIDLLFERMPTIRANVELLRNTAVSSEQISLYLSTVAQKIIEGIKPTHVDLNVFRPRRQADVASDAYTIFNRGQEVALKGGMRYRTLVEVDNRQRYKNNTTRAIKSIDRQLEMNKFCWDKAQEILLAA
jgi:hypothetical protein